MSPRLSPTWPLASYLLAANFSYCRPKVVNSPTLSEMAILIHLFNKGAVSGLESVGFITPRAHPSKKLGKEDLKPKEDVTYLLLTWPENHHKIYNHILF